MAIPDYQTIMLPLLQAISDGSEFKMSELTSELADKFKLSEEELKEYLPSGRAPMFYNRVAWAKTYLKKAGLVDSPRTGYVKISKRGSKVLDESPGFIDVKYLKKYDEFVEFQSTSKSTSDSTEVIASVEEVSDKTPQEIIESEVNKLKSALAEDILKMVVDSSPLFFENLVVELLVKMGYGGSIKDAGQATKRTGDEGIDGTIKEDKLGLDVIYIQAKRWSPGNTVGRPEIQKFVGALAGQGAKKGVFITTSSFSKEAIDYVPRNETKIVLIDGRRLAQLMIDYNLGVNTEETYEIKQIDTDFFEEN